MDDDLSHLFSHGLHLGTSTATTWHSLGSIHHRGTGWYVRDPAQEAGPPDLFESFPGTWILQARLRKIRRDVPNEIQCMCVWEDTPAPLVWRPMPPTSLDTGCLVVCEGHAFRRDDHAHEYLEQYRGFHAERAGDHWMLAGFQHLDASPRSCSLPGIHFMQTPHSWWFDTEPIVFGWEAAFLDNRACGMRWALPIEGAASWEP